MTDRNGRDLCVLCDFIPRPTLNRLTAGSAIKVAFSVEAMLAFDTAGEEYLTLNDLYPADSFREDATRMILDCETIFSDLDKICETKTGFPRSYTGNIYWFLLFFLNFLYLDKIVGRICEMRTGRVRIVGHSLPDEEMSGIGYSGSHSTGTAAFDRFSGFQNKIDLICTALRSEPGIDELRPALSRGDGNMAYRSHSVVSKIKYWLSGVFRLKLSAEMRNHVGGLSRLNRKKGTIFVIQDKYEVRFLKQYLPEFKFFNPMPDLARQNRKAATGICGPDQIRDLCDDLVNKWFPRFASHTWELIEGYHHNIVPTIAGKIQSVRQMFQRERPAALFFSSGANMVAEDVCAYVANEHRIPVFYFQHGVGSALTRNPFQRYFERNRRIRKIRIVKSPLELNIAAEDGDVAQAQGSIYLHRFNRIKPKRRRKILYICNAFNDHAYKELFLDAPDAEKYRVNTDIVRAVNLFDLRMDIKPGTVDKKRCRRYFAQLLRHHRSHNIGLLSDIPAESIIKNYDLVIMEYLTSALTALALMIDVPIILYLRETWTLRPHFRADLDQRVYRVGSAAELEDALNRYALGNLSSKWTPGIIDRYAYPSQNGDPGTAIAALVKRTIDQGVGTRP